MRSGAHAEAAAAGGIAEVQKSSLQKRHQPRPGSFREAELGEPVMKQKSVQSAAIGPSLLARTRTANDREDVRGSPSPSVRRGRIAVRSQGTIFLLDPDEVLVVKAHRHCVILQRQTDSKMLRMSISVMAEKLKSYGFIRIHRSTLVNCLYVEAMRPLRTGEYRLSVKGGREYIATRTYRTALRGLAGVWIGLDPFTGEPCTSPRRHEDDGDQNPSAAPVA
jgi:DNA-binding LytR/AlgR family response regulator